MTFDDLERLKEKIVLRSPSDKFEYRKIDGRKQSSC